MDLLIRRWMRSRDPLDFFLIIFIMAPFTAAMLTTTPSPEPEPVVQGHCEDTRMEDANTESDTDRLFGAWTAILTSLEGCVMTAPDLKPELLEDQEMWLREWHSVLVSALSGLFLLVI